VPLNIIALSTLPAAHPDAGHGDPQPDAHLGGSTASASSFATLAENTQIVHSRLVERLRPTIRWLRRRFLPAPVQPDDAAASRRSTRR